MNHKKNHKESCPIILVGLCTTFPACVPGIYNVAFPWIQGRQMKMGGEHTHQSTSNRKYCMFHHYCFGTMMNSTMIQGPQMCRPRQLSQQSVRAAKQEQFCGSFKGRISPRCRAAVLAMGAAQKTVLVPIADGSEEAEAVIIVDVLRRAGNAPLGVAHP